jgi:hypothetical protein
MGLKNANTQAMCAKLTKVVPAGTLLAVTNAESYCQDAGPHPPRHAAKKDSMINEH